MNFDAEEKAILASYKRGEWRPVKATKRSLDRYVQYAKATLRKAAALIFAFPARTWRQSKNGRSKKVCRIRP